MKMNGLDVSNPHRPDISFPMLLGLDHSPGTSQFEAYLATAVDRSWEWKKSRSLMAGSWRSRSVFGSSGPGQDEWSGRQGEAKSSPWKTGLTFSNGP